MTDIILETIRALILIEIVIFLWNAGRDRFELSREGWNLIIWGFSLLLFGSLLDITDNFETLNKYVVIGDTKTEAFLEKFVGFLGGFVLIAIGLFRWIPKVQSLSDTIDARTRNLQEAYESLVVEIAKRKEIETVLKESEERFRNITDYSPSFITLKDNDGRHQFVNQKHLDMFGLQPSDVLGKINFKIFPENQAKEATAQDRKVIETKAANTMERQITTLQGTRDFLITKFPVLDGSGEVTRIGTIGTDITERKQAEAALKESEARFKSLAKTASDRFWEMDENFCFKANTDAIDREFPIEPGRFIGRTRWQAAGVDPDKNEKWRLHREDLLAHRPFRDFEYALPGEDGATRHLNISGSPIFDDTGAFKGYRGSATDITERKQAEEAARESDERLRGAVESMQEGFALYDADDRLVAFNKEYQRIQPLAQEIMDAGGTFEDVIRTQVKKGYIPEAKGQEEAFIKERLERHHYPQGPIYRQFEDGKWCLINETRTPEGGTALSFTDITELKKAEEALSQSEERLRNVIDNLPMFITLKDTEGRFKLVNRKHADLWGVEPQDIQGKKISEVFEKSAAKASRAHDRKVIETKAVVVEERPVITTEGAKDFLITKFPILEGSGALKEIATIGVDITERKQAHDALVAAMGEAETANRAKSEFLAAMSHELRTPLNAILGFADILSNQYFGPPGAGKYREYAEDIQASGEHLLELVNEILDLSAIEAGKQSLVKERLSLVEIVMECEKIIEDKAHSNGIGLVTKVPEDLPPLYADKRATKQILLNLLSNAVKYTPEGGKVTVSAKGSKRTTTLKIADTGKGIPADKLPDLTEPFARVERDSYLAEQGWGLGLSITKSLVDLHEGSLEIKSTLGKGTTVTVTLPNGAA